MIDLKGVKLENARSVYMTANTPMYLVRNLRSDPEVVKIHLRNSTESILEELRDRLERLPLEFDDRLLPLVLVSALALKQDRKAILEAAGFDGTNYRWYKSVTNSLLQQVRPTTVSKIFAPTLISIENTAQNRSKSTYQVVEVSQL